MSIERVIFYIDGFNLYYGLKEKGWKKYYWLNLQEMCARLTLPDQELIKVQYFTTRISGADEDKRQRQNRFIEALETLPLVDIHYGVYISSPQICFNCGHTFIKHNEKKTDVNIAVRMITDGLEDLYDTAILISADGDLTPAVEAIKQYLPEKRVKLFFPPTRSSLLLKKVCHKVCGTINRTTVSKSQFSDTVKSKSGYHLTRPSSWV